MMAHLPVYLGQAGDPQTVPALAQVDVVEILLPHHLHYQATLDAAAAGKHISLQKPMALSLAEADEMIEAAKVMTQVDAAGNVTQVGITAGMTAQDHHWWRDGTRRRRDVQ